MAVNYDKENLTTEDECWSLVEKFIKRSLVPDSSIELLRVKVNDLGASSGTNKVLWWLQKNGGDFVVDYGAKNFAVMDYKGTKGFSIDGELFPGFYKLTMELFCKKAWELEPTDRRDYVSYKSYAFLSKGFAKNNQYILYISELMAVLIPKHGLEAVMKKHSYKFETVFDEPWKLNYSDHNKEKMVKNVIFNLHHDKDLKILLEANTKFFRLLDGTYKEYNPLKVKPFQIRKDYIKSKKEYIIKNK